MEKLHKKHQYGGLPKTTLAYYHWSLVPEVNTILGEPGAASREYVIFLGKRCVQAKVYFKSGSLTNSPWVSKHALGHDQAKGRDKS